MGTRKTHRLLVVGLVGTLLVGVLARAASADDPLFANWTALLPSLTDTYDPNSANDCTAGRPNCVDITIREMQRRYAPLSTGCDHNAVFALAYLRTTQTYEWARDQSGFFQDTRYVNHEDAVFAKYYFRAYDDWAAGRTSSVPEAWRIALDAARNRQATGSGNLLLGMNAHVNRDLPIVLASIGITYPDGTTRKGDHDKVNQFLNAVLQPLLAEEGARFDPSINSIPASPYGVGYTALFQLLAGWRESAWRYAEALTDAPTAADKAIVLQALEDNAAANARLILASNAYVPPLTNSTSRDAFCAANQNTPAPMPYAFGTA